MPSLLPMPTDKIPSADDDEKTLSDETIAEAFSGLTQIVSNRGTLDATLEFIYENFKGFVPFDRLGCALLDQSGQRVVARWCRSNHPIQLNNGYSAQLAGSSLQLILQRQCPRILNDLEEYLRNRPESGSTKLIVREGYRSSLTCPLIVEEKGIGFLFFTSVEPDVYSEDHVSAFQEIAGLLSLNILISSERERSTALLDSYIDLLADMVGLVRPFANVSARRAEELIDRMVEQMRLSDAVEFTRAARLCRIGWITAPADLTDLTGHRALPGISEQPSLPTRAAFTSKLISRIPGLDLPAKIIALHEEPYAALCSRYGDIDKHRPALGAALLRLALDFDSLRHQGMTNSWALRTIRNAPETYAPFLVDVLEQVVGIEPQPTLKEISVDKLCDGMLLEEHVMADNGSVLISSGRVIDKALRKQIKRFVQRGNTICEPLLVSLQSAPDDGDTVDSIAGFGEDEQEVSRSR